MLVLAHLGHWYISLPTFMAPVVLVAGWVWFSGWRERRHGPDGGDPPAPLDEH
jgi:hypothetical protein